MKTLAAIIILTATLTVAAPQVMYDNGTDTPRITRLPTKSTLTLDGTKRISQIRTEAQANACGYYNIERAAPDAGNRIVASDWNKVGNVFVQTITEQISIADEWAANNQKGTQQLEWEQQLTNDVAIAFNGATPPYSEAAYANLQVQAAAKRLAAREVVATADLTTAQGRATFNAALAQYHRIHAIESRIKLLQDAFPSFQITNNSTIGRQPTTGDYPQ